ncbi:MAG: hypothetical protein E6G42_02925 [Actinobacteria bacterium]|nr:MAG: hypothetical protein E6G42_02925 [Actinomycetota bacterium]
MVHGRFQPFHNGHLEYLRGAAARCDELFVGITNPDPRRIKEEPSDPLRCGSSPTGAGRSSSGCAPPATRSWSSTRAPRRRSPAPTCGRRCATGATGSRSCRPESRG